MKSLSGGTTHKVIEVFTQMQVPLPLLPPLCGLEIPCSTQTPSPLPAPLPWEPTTCSLPQERRDAALRRPVVRGVRPGVAELPRPPEVPAGPGTMGGRREKGEMGCLSVVLPR